MNPFSNDYSAADVSAATGLAPATLQNWLKRDVIVGHREGKVTGGGSPGRHRRFTFNTVMEIALAAAFVKTGVGVEAAFQAVKSYAYVGESVTFWEGEEPAPTYALRQPGLPFAPSRGETFLILADGKNTLTCVPPGSTRLQKMLEAGSSEGFCIVNAGKVFHRVTDNLGFHASEVLTFAYPEAEAK